MDQPSDSATRDSEPSCYTALVEIHVLVSPPNEVLPPADSVVIFTSYCNKAVTIVPPVTVLTSIVDDEWRTLPLCEADREHRLLRERVRTYKRAKVLWYDYIRIKKHQNRISRGARRCHQAASTVERHRRLKRHALRWIKPCRDLLVEVHVVRAEVDNDQLVLYRSFRVPREPATDAIQEVFEVLAAVFERHTGANRTPVAGDWLTRKCRQ